MFDRKTIDYGRVDFTSCGVYVYSSYCDRRPLSNVPCARILDARWVGQTIHVVTEQFTYVYTGFGNYSHYFPTH